jgi:hypothetical protein
MLPIEQSSGSDPLPDAVCHTCDIKWEIGKAMHDPNECCHETFKSANRDEKGQ